MIQWATKNKTQHAFTIVELLIVVVVIAILAAITLVAYNGIRERAVQSQVQSALSQANKKVKLYAATNSDQYPVSLAAIGITNSDTVAYQYTVDNTVNPATYALTASNGVVGDVRYHVSSANTVTAGIAPGHNLMPWDEPNPESRPVISSIPVIDTSEFYSAPASIRIEPGVVQNALRLNPIEGEVGQTVTVSLWIKTDPGWNGTDGNSKIRFGASPSGSLIKACGFAGEKLTWTQVDCSYTLTEANTALIAYVGNNGTVGNIWIDDVVISIQ